MNPAHYKATYDAPTTQVLPHVVSFQNISSEVITCSFPSILSMCGLPPTAINIFFA